MAETHLSDLLHAHHNSAMRIFAEQGIPYRSFQLETLNEFSMGALLAHCILETLLLAYLLDVDPFGQPAVESLKGLSKEFLIKQIQKRNDINPSR